MGRLIDADLFVKEYSKIFEPYKDNEIMSIMFDHFIDAVKTFPTAYDVEKVVEELEKEKEIHTKNYNSSLYKDYPEVKHRYEQTQFVIDNAIEKVRKGGV